MSSTLEALSWPLPSPGPNVSGADPRWTKNTKPCSELTNVERCRTRGDLNACEHNFGCNVSLNGEQPSASFNLVRSHEIDTPDNLLTARHKLRMRKTLTARQCETLSCPPPRRRIDYRDTVVPGLCLRVTATARKTFTLRTRVNRRQVRYAIGSYPLISLADAREQARKILRDNQLGRYERPEEQKVLTLGEVVPEFIAKHVMVKNRDQNATRGCLKRFEPLYGMPLADVKRAHVIRILDSIMGEGKPYRANRALASIKKLFAWSRDRGYIEHHPIDRLKPPGKEIARDRILSDRELGGALGNCGKDWVSVRARHSAADPHRSASWRGHDDALVRHRLRARCLDHTCRCREERPRARGATVATRAECPRRSAAVRRVRPRVHDDWDDAHSQGSGGSKIA